MSEVPSRWLGKFTENKGILTTNDPSLSTVRVEYASLDQSRPGREVGVVARYEEKIIYSDGVVFGKEIVIADKSTPDQLLKIWLPRSNNVDNDIGITFSQFRNQDYTVGSLSFHINATGSASMMRVSEFFSGKFYGKKWVNRVLAAFPDDYILHMIKEVKEVEEDGKTILENTEVILDEKGEGEYGRYIERESGRAISLRHLGGFNWELAHTSDGNSQRWVIDTTRKYPISRIKSLETLPIEKVAIEMMDIFGVLTNPQVVWSEEGARLLK